MKRGLYKNFIWGMTASVLIFTPLARGAVNTWSIAPVLAAVYILIFLWLFSIRARPAPTGIDMPILVFALLSIVSAVVSIYKHDSIPALMKLFSYIGIYYLVAGGFDRGMIRRLFGLVVFMGTGLSLYGLLQYSGIFAHGWWDPKGCLAATYVNHNHFAGYLELVIPVAVCRSLAYRPGSGIHRMIRAVVIAASILMIAAFMLTQSCGAWFSLSVSFFAMIVVVLKKRSGSINTLFVIILILAAVSLLGYFGKDIICGRINQVCDTKTEGTSLWTRLNVWRGAIGMIKDRPITGSGIGTFSWGFNRFRPEGFNVQANFAHNDYLEAAAEMGIAAPILMIVIFVAVIRKGFKSGDLLKTGCAAGMMSLAIHGLVDFNFHIPANMLLFTVWAATIMQPGHE